VNLSLADELCRRFEGLHRLGTDGLVYPYICPAGYPTQGWGTVVRPDGRRVTMADPPITRETADQWLKHELVNTYAPSVVRLCPPLYAKAMATESWGAFCAIVDFAYNLGAGRLQTSTLRRKINAGDWEGAAAELPRWVYGGGRKLPGLVLRREAERVAFLK